METQAKADELGSRQADPRMRRRRLRRLLSILAVAAALLIFLTWRWMLSPSTTPIDELGTADAVVLFAGGRGERLDTALELVTSGVAPVLVISNGYLEGWTAAAELCPPASPPADVEVLCPTPVPDTSQGEGRMFAALANERGWDEVIGVTSTYHVTRARLVFDRCFDGDIISVSAGIHSAGSLPRLLTREWLATVNTRVLARAC